MRFTIKAQVGAGLRLHHSHAGGHGRLRHHEPRRAQRYHRAMCCRARSRGWSWPSRSTSPILADHPPAEELAAADHAMTMKPKPAIAERRCGAQGLADALAAVDKPSRPKRASPHWADARGHCSEVHVRPMTRSASCCRPAIRPRREQHLHHRWPASRGNEIDSVLDEIDRQLEKQHAWSDADDGDRRRSMQARA